jgi:hypothetical protein
VLSGVFEVKADFIKYLHEFFGIKTTLTITDKLQLLKFYNQMVRKKPAQPTESVMITKDGRAEFKLGGELENGTLSQAMDVERMSSTPNGFSFGISIFLLEITDSHRNLKTPLVTFPKRVRRNSEGIMITIEKLSLLLFSAV